MQYVWIGLGGAIGSMLRFLVQTLIQGNYSGLFPLGTLAVNLIGSFVVGILGGLFDSTPVPTHLRAFLMAGVLGGFTTFSAYSFGSLTMIRAGQAKSALLYILVSNVFGILLAFSGYFLAKFALRFFQLETSVG